jgi:hypothetical protein
VPQERHLVVTKALPLTVRQKKLYEAMNMKKEVMFKELSVLILEMEEKFIEA